MPDAPALLHGPASYTVTQRLDRVGRLLGRDRSAPDRVLEVQLALRLHPLASGWAPGVRRRRILAGCTA